MVELVADPIVGQRVLHWQLQLRLVLGVLELLGGRAIDTFRSVLLYLTPILIHEVRVHLRTQAHEFSDWIAGSLILEFSNHLKKYK